jgi:hypothetical protein
MECFNRKDFKSLLKELKIFFNFICSGTLLYKVIPHRFLTRYKVIMKELKTFKILLGVN